MYGFKHFGLTSKAVSIDVHTDSEREVGEIIGNSTGRYTFSIRRAAPQQHRSVGAAERTVRELKESFSVLRADLNAQGLDVMFSHENLVDVLTYLALCNNHFSTSRGSDRSPLEMVSGRKFSKPVCTLYGSQVLAEILIQFVSIHRFQQGMLSVLSFTWDWNEVQLYKVSFVWMAKLS